MKALFRLVKSLEQKLRRLNYLKLITLVQRWIVGVIVPYRQHQIASGFVQVQAKDCRSRQNAETGLADQPFSNHSLRHADICRETGEPARVYLHHPEISGPVIVPNDAAYTPALDELHGRQHARRQPIELCGNYHTSDIRDRHANSPMRQAILCYDPGLRQRRPEPEAGLTILEMLVVVAIMALLLGIVAPAVLRQLAGARVKVAKQSIEQLCSVLDIYKLDVGSYPTTADGLRALVDKPTYATNWTGPYLTSGDGLIDPWGHAYIYRSPSERNGHDYDICSRGPDANSPTAMICNP